MGEQFNEEQLVIAHSVASLIERDLGLLKKEIYLLRKEISAGDLGPEARDKAVQSCFSRVLENGVWKIEIIDLHNSVTLNYTPYRHWSAKGLPESRSAELLPIKELSSDTVWVSQPQTKQSGISVALGTALPGEPARLLLFNTYVSWFLAPFLTNIRSGKTGYAWLIDEKGVFLFHPESDFVGKSAFEARKAKDPSISYAKINFIQKEKMLKGREGTGSYYTGWHRGITGKIKKLIAYCPINVSDNPPQKWSVAVVAPISEIEGVIRKGYVRLFMLQGMVIIAILMGAAAVLFFEMRWSRVLERRVNRRTEELERSEEKYRSLVESAEDFIFTVDLDGHLKSVNSFTANFFGGHPDDFLGKDLSSLFPEDVAEKQRKLIRLVYRHKKSVRAEFELRTGEHRIWINANFMPLRNEDGDVNAILCIARDITENRILERQLINTEKLASLGTLAAGVAHEVNNPLGVMLGFCDVLLRQTEQGTQVFEDLKTIERQGLHCKQVVENLLSFARLEGGESEYSDLNLCIKEIVNVVKHTLEMKDIELHMKLGENIPMVKGDPRQLQQVFLNLINNAVSAMGHGGALRICTLLERGRRRAIIQFHDAGVGIKEEHMDHIFEPFFTTKPEGEGTGLGLFVSYGIIAKYGGSMDCASHTVDVPDNTSGTTFTIKLLTKRGEE